jgi:hypothetical protein
MDTRHPVAYTPRAMKRRRLALWGLVATLNAVVLVFACAPDDSSNYVNAYDLPPGGQFVNPGVVTCGDLEAGCPGECCLGSGTPACPPGTGSVTCNETADCQIHNACCASPPGVDGGYLSATCATSCPSPQVQLCRTNGECPNDKCYIERCSDGLLYEMCEPYATPSFSCKVLSVYPDGGLEE